MVRHRRTHLLRRKIPPSFLCGTIRGLPFYLKARSIEVATQEDRAYRLRKCLFPFPPAPCLMCGV
jgi:hypothetical protein